MKIPVFHDDQHGTAITVSAAFINGLKVVGKDIRQVKVVTSGAGAAALACLDLMVDLGLPIENVWATDIEGVVYQGRATLMDPDKARFAQDTSARTLDEVIEGADVFLGLSAGGVLSAAMLKKMAANPLILALANPTPEIFPELAHATREDVVIATGRSDFPNQVNNVLCFPYIFRGALDVGATTITRRMEIAAVHAIAGLAQEEANDAVAAAYGAYDLSFGPKYLIPKPFDSRLILRIAPAVARAAIEDGVATRPITDFAAYTDQLQQFVYHSGAFMKPLFAAAKQFVRDGAKTRIVFAEGEEERVLRAVQVIVDEKLARPILIGRPEVLLARIEKFGLRLRLGEDVEVTNPEYDERFHQYWTTYWELRCRDGITKEMARVEMRRRLTLIGAMMVRLGDADGMICGTVGAYHDHLRFVDEAIGKQRGARTYAAMNILLLDKRTVALVDTHVNDNPNAEQIAEFTVSAASQMAWLNLQPKVALLSRSKLRLGQLGLGGEDARGAGAGARARARSRDRGRDARRLRARRGAAPAHPAAFAAQGRGQPAGLPERGRRQHRLQPAEDQRGQQRGGRAVPARRQRAGQRADLQLDRAPDRQHDGPHGTAGESGLNPCRLNGRMTGTSGGVCKHAARGAFFACAAPRLQSRGSQAP